MLYGFVVNFRENFLSVGQVKIKLSMAKMTGCTNHSNEQVILAEEEVYRCEQGEPFLLQAEMENELGEDVPICVMAKDVIGKPPTSVEERLFLVS